MKDDLGGNIMMECFALRSKRYPYITDDDNNIKTAKGKKMCNKKNT